jgi:hypothetical protein
MGKLDDLVRTLGSQASPPRYEKVRDAAEAIYGAEGPGWRLAEDLLYQFPGSPAKIDQVVGDNQMQLGRYLGAGKESLVFEAIPRSGDGSQVLKVRVGGAEPSDFGSGHLDGVPGVVPYWGAQQAGQDVAVAFQPMAKAVYSPKRGLEVPFSRGAERLKQSLLARGVDWGDSHKFNVGAMQDGTWGAIDGWIFPAHRDWKLPQIPEEEAIRMLRLTPEERLGIYGDAAP